ncbi:RHS repeat protein [Pseudomonas sp. D(2018)]|uniref:RHS repeat protein n=1 Tax=Pseudomonas sp. D(2018) TaxID=2502238 RepID=UPI0010F50B7B|nr:RHS repeat protein [Pseudomonas sp. D(2018)]
MINFLPHHLAVLLLVASNAASQARAADESFNEAAVGSYQEPGYAANRDYSEARQVDSVDPFTGALKINIRDLHIPGNGGLDIEVVRNYQSVTNEQGPYSNGYRERTPFGTGWDLHFGRLWVSKTYGYLNQADNNRGCQISNQVASNLNPILELPDGSRQVLANGDGQDHAFITKERWIGRCLPRSMNKGDGGLVVISPGGLKYIFDKKGTVSPDQQLRAYFVTRIEDPDGNFLDFTYNVGPHNLYGRHHLLKSIQASDGRSVHLAYRDETGQRPVLDSIIANGVTIRYAYIDANWGIGAKPHYLESVNYPDGTRWSYTYNNASNLTGTVPGRFAMTSMTSPMGLRTSYAYEYRQMGPNPAEKLNVISRRTLSGIQGAPTEQVWEYQYAKGRAPSNDQTLVKGPLQCIGYEHVGTDTIANGATGVNRGLWKVGALVRKYTAARADSGCGPALRTETYTWTSQGISSQHEMRRYNLLVEDRTRAALLASKVIAQDGASYSTRYTYDAYGQPLTVAEQGQLARTTTYSYVRPGGHWMLGKIASQTVSGIPSSISYSYTSTGRLIQQAKYGVVTRFGHTSTGDLASVVDANGRVTLHVGHVRGIPLQTTQPDGGVIRRTVNPTGTLASVTDPLGRVTSYTYDAMNRVTVIRLPKSALTRYNISYAFDAAGVTETLNRTSYSRTRRYNQLGQLTRQTEAGGSAPIVVSAAYRADGQKSTMSLPGYGQAGALQSFEYDGLGRRTQGRHADGNITGIRYTGNSEIHRDERGYETTYSYASFGNPEERLLVQIVQPGNLATKLSRDSLGRLIAIEQDGLTRRYDYDSRGFLVSEYNPETLTTAYGYDAVGNRISRKVSAADTDLYSYDAMDRLVRITYPANQVFTFGYDLGGRLLRQTSYQGTSWDYTYNAHDQVITETLTLSAPQRSFTIRYGYDPRDNLHAITYPSGLAIDYAPDAYGRPTKAGPFAHDIRHYPNGDLQSLTYANGTRLSVAQDPLRLWPTSRTVDGLPQRSLALRLLYDHDPSGNKINIWDLWDTLFDQRLGYDGANRLIQASGYWGRASYSYNSRGDIASQTIAGNTLSYGYDNQGRLATLSGSLNTTYRYNNRGNTILGRARYTYDNASQMLQYCREPQLVCPRPNESYIYDPRGYRAITTFANGPHELSLYGQNGQLIREDFPADGGFVEHIYVGKERVASRMQCEFVDSNGDGISNCQDRRYAPSR